MKKIPLFLALTALCCVMFGWLFPATVSAIKLGIDGGLPIPDDGKILICD